MLNPNQDFKTLGNGSVIKMTASQARGNFRNVLDGVEFREKTVLLTRYGRPCGAIISNQRFRLLMALKRNPEMLKQLSNQN